MSGVLPRYKEGPRSYQVSAAVKGGQLVVPDTANVGKVKVAPAAAGVANVLGVALVDAQPAADQSGDTTSYGAPVIDVSVPGDTTSVAYGGICVPVTYQAAASFGDKLIASATVAGQVAPAAATPDARTIVGVCDEPKGVAAGAVGLMRTA